MRYNQRKVSKSAATAEIARDADDIDFNVDDVYSALTLAFNGIIIS